MDYQPSDFTSLQLNPYPVPENADLISEFKVLGHYKVFKKRIKGLNTNKLIRYIIYAFDENSPLNSIKDVLQRRVEAAMIAGFKPDDGKFTQEEEAMLKSANPEVNAMVVQYCVMFFESDYAILVTYQDGLRKLLEKMMNADEESDFKNLISATNSLRTEIKKLQDSIFQGNTDKFLLRSLSDFSEAEKLELSPEYFAKVTEQWNNVSRYFSQARARQ